MWFMSTVCILDYPTVSNTVLLAHVVVVPLDKVTGNIEEIPFV